MSIQGFKREFVQFLIEFKVLMKKNGLLFWRNSKSSACQLITPIVIIVLLYIIQVAVSSTEDLDPSVIPEMPIPPCNGLNGANCITILWTVDTQFINNTNIINGPLTGIPLGVPVPALDSMMNDVASSNGLSTGSTSQHQAVAKIDGTNNFYQFLINKQNYTQIGIIFYENFTLIDSFFPNKFGAPIHYTIVYNDSTNDPNYSAAIPNIIHSVHVSINRAILNYFAANASGNLNYQVSTRSYPYLGTKLDVVALLGSVLFYCAIMFNFVIILYSIVQEKELKLRQGMKMMGLSDLSYWMSWFIWNNVVVVFISLLIIATGAIVQFGFFLKTNFFVLFFTFYLFGLAMTPISFVFSMLVRTVKQAILAGIGFLIIGIIAQIVFSIPGIINLIYLNSPSGVFVLLGFYPPYNFARIVSDIGTLSNQQSLQDNTPGYSWSNLYDSHVVNGSSNSVTVPSTSVSLWYQVMSLVSYGFLAWYLYNVLPGEKGLTPWFLFTPNYWGIRSSRTPPKDVELEEGGSEEPAIQIIDLVKRYNSIPCINTEQDTIAVKGLNLKINKGQVFALLGHNGAGKTTTINMLTGLFPPTSGDAFVYGKSIISDIGAIQRQSGVCPQHNILWDELTAAEHIDIFAELKGISRKERPAMIEARLKDVLLWNVSKHKSSTFSGGMKRRLSVAIASTGAPDVIFLDEPTTGLDPMSRREIWGSIQRLKANSVIVLTTHSMEEADVLGDTIGIMSQGTLKCLGTSLHLKNQYGAGYRLNFNARDESLIPQLKTFITEKLSAGQIIAETGTYFIVSYPTEAIDNLIGVFEFIESNKTDSNFFIRDWGVSQTTLEEVFLKVTDAHVSH